MDISFVLFTTLITATIFIGVTELIDKIGKHIAERKMILKHGDSFKLFLLKNRKKNH